jgi:hypothetical protein
MYVSFRLLVVSRGQWNTLSCGVLIYLENRPMRVVV